MSSVALDGQIENAFQHAKRLKEHLDRIGRLGETYSSLPREETKLAEELDQLTLILEQLNVTGREMAAHNQALATENRIYHSLFEFVTDGCLMTDAEGVIQQVNQAATMLLNESRASLTGQPLVRFLTEDDRPTFQAYLIRLRDARIAEVKGWEVQVQPTGRPNFMAILAGTAVSDERDQRSLLLWQLRDITERKQIEQDLQESQGRLQAIFDYTQDAILLADDQACYIDVNPAACALLGYSRDEFLQLTLWDLTPVVSHEVGQQLWREFLAAGNLAGEYSLQCKDGLDVVVDYRAVANIVPGLHLSVLRDITERKHAYEAVKQQRNLLRALTKRLAEIQELERTALARELHDQVDQYLTGLDLNLNIIHGQLSGVSAPTKQLIQLRLDDSLALVAEMAERVRDLMGELVPPVLDDYGLVAALEWYGNKFASRVGFTFTVQGQEPVPRLATAVEHVLFRITQEALTNVAKHTHASNVTLTLKTVNNTVQLVIADNGRGFVAGGTTQDPARKGWGLMMMAERARTVGGHCRIESTPGYGTRVIVEVPRIESSSG